MGTVMYIHPIQVLQPGKSKMQRKRCKKPNEASDVDSELLPLAICLAKRYVHLEDRALRPLNNNKNS